jgi:hypothetical protein
MLKNGRSRGKDKDELLNGDSGPERPI